MLILQHDQVITLSAYNVVSLLHCELMHDQFVTWSVVT